MHNKWLYLNIVLNSQLIKIMKLFWVLRMCGEGMGGRWVGCGVEDRV